MNFLSISAFVLLVGITVWIWRLSKAQITDLSLKTSLTPVQSVTASSMLKPNAFRIQYNKAVTIIKKITPFAILAGLIFVGVYFLYQKVKDITWMSSNISLVIGIVILIVILRWAILKEKIPTAKFKDLEKIGNWKKEGYDIVSSEAEKIFSKITYARIEPKKSIQYSGFATLPQKVYVGDSHNISINLKPAFLISYGEESFHVEDSISGKTIILHIQPDNSLEQFLDIQLLAAGLVVDGEKTQRQRLTLSTLVTLTYSWNCYFRNSGDHVISLILRVVSQSTAIELGTIQHSVKVAQLDHLTQRQVQMAGIITGGLAVAISLQQLGVLQKIIFYMFP